MKIIEPSVELFEDFDGEAAMKKIERAGRTCYKSEANITETSATQFVRNLIKRGHESVLEHCAVTFKIICDRGVMAELTRHRLASFSVESTRYCDYKDGVQFISPFAQGTMNFVSWENLMMQSELFYKHLRANGAPPELARSVLPMSLATEMVVTANLREWRLICKLRTNKKAHPQMRQVAGMILDILKEKLPVVFEDIGGETHGISAHDAGIERTSGAAAR